MPRVPPFLIRSADKLLVSKAIKSFGPQGSYQLPVRKMVFEMSPKAVSHHGLRTYVLHRLGLVQLAKTYPSVEFVVKDSTKTHPLIRSFYVNGAHKEVNVKDKSHFEVQHKVDMMMQSSGHKVRKFTQSVESFAPSARGIFSQHHSADRTRFYDGLPKPALHK